MIILILYQGILSDLLRDDGHGQYKSSSVSSESIKDVIIGNQLIDDEDREFINSLDDDDFITEQPSFTVLTRDGFIKLLEYKNIV